MNIFAVKLPDIQLFHIFNRKPKNVIRSGRTTFYILCMKNPRSSLLKIKTMETQTNNKQLLVDYLRDLSDTGKIEFLKERANAIVEECAVSAKKGLYSHKIVRTEKIANDVIELLTSGKVRVKDCSSFIAGNYVYEIDWSVIETVDPVPDVASADVTIKTEPHDDTTVKAE